MSILGPDNKLASLHVDADGRLLVSGSGGGTVDLATMTTAASAGTEGERTAFKAAVGAEGSTLEEVVSTTTYTYVAADFDGKTKVFTSASGCLATIPDTLALAAGKVSQWRQAPGAGQITFAVGGAATAVSLNGELVSGGENSVGALVSMGSDDFLLMGQIRGESVSFTVPIGDETTAITTGLAKVTFRMPFPMVLTAVRASLTTVSSSGIPTFDINEGGVSILSTKLTVDANEKTSTTAATAAVISDSALADDAEMTIDVDVAGTGAAGAKITFYGRALT